MAKVKHMQKSAVDPFPTPDKTQVPPPPNKSDDNIPFVSLLDSIPTTKVTLKKKTSPNSPCTPVPHKKTAPISPSAPFLNGMLGKLYFSLAKVNSYSDIPEGKSIIINHFHKALPHKKAESPYILIDAFNNL